MEAMARKEYKKLIDQLLTEFRDDPDRADEFLSEDQSAEDDGEMFFCISSTAREAESSRPIRRLFDEAGLDAKNPFHWLYLVEGLADIHFSQGKAGAKPKRTPNYFKDLLLHYEGARRGNPEHTDEQLCGDIQSKYPEEYGHLKVASIRRMIPAIKKSRC
jgi:hypothetical protein